MKRDWDLIRKILLATENIESNETPVTSSTMKEECTEDVFSYHGILLKEAGLVIAIPVGTFDIYIYRLTWKGHEFLDSIRNDTTWNKIKNSTTEKGLELSFDSIKEIAKYLVIALISH